MTRFASEWGFYCIDPVPQQPQWAHCHSFFVPVDKRGEGYGKKLKEHQNETLKQLGYDFATCTTTVENIRQHRVLQKSGWGVLHRFNNRNTGSETIVWCYEVPRG